MARELRLGFALGGAVSLGTFTGAAVAQALKLAILRARPRNETERYNRVVLDVLSGASAGAMSLALLLRALVHQSEGDRREAEQRLLAEFGESEDFTEDNPRPDSWRRTAAISAEVALMLHERVWGNDIHINELAGSLGKMQALYAGGLLDRRAVDRIARRYLPLPDSALPHRGGVLGDRVLAAMSIANLTPVIADARQVQSHPGMLKEAAADAARSNVRAELRVFDLHFEEVDNECTDPHLHPPRWCRYHIGPKRRGVIGDLRSDAFWERLGGTAIASGAVPCAFEPVVLERKAWEYGPNLWPSELGRYPETEIPKTGQAPCGPPYEYPSAKFTYVDGGTLNNEPIREAFSLASYQDGKEAEMPFDRQIIFVDTFVGEEEPDYAVPIHARFGVHKKAIARLTSIDRLMPAHLGSLVSLLRDEASVVELDKVEAVRNRFQTRDRLRELLRPETVPLNRDVFDVLATFCRRELARDQMGSLLPRAGYRLEDELLRVRREMKDPRDVLGLDQAWSGTSSSHREAQRRWSCALLGVVVDILMDLPGKSAEASLIPVGPFVRRADGGYARVPLPGEGMAGFLGFLARAHRPFEFRAGKRAVREALEAAELLPEGQALPSEHPRTLTSSEEQHFEAQVERGQEVLKRRVRALAEHAVRLDIGPFGIVRGFARRGLENLLDKIADPRPVSAMSVDFCVRVPEDKLEIRGIDGPDLKPVSPRLEPRDASLIVTRLTAHTDGDRWHWVGPGVDEHEGVQVITVDRHLSLFGAWTRIELPTREETLKLVARSACPTLELQLTPNHQDRIVARSQWRPFDVVAALDRTLISEKSDRPSSSG